MRKTLKDIAKIARVSPGTVSKVINNYSDVGEKTREKILKVIEQTGYQANIKTKKKVIGLIYGVDVRFNHPFFTEVIHSLSKEIGYLGFDLLVFTSGNSSEGKDVDYLAKCREADVSACIIIGGDDKSASFYKALDQSDIPCIGIDIQLTGHNSGYLMSDNVSIGRQVIEHLYLLGHREIGYIGGLQNTIIGKERTDGFLQAMTEFGLTINDRWLMYGDFIEPSGYARMNELLSKNQELPSAIFVASDMMAIGAIKAIKEYDLKVPDDIAVIGCDDIEVSQYLDQPLTTIRQDKERIGKLAAYMIKDLVNGKTHSSSVLIDPTLMIRETCGANTNKVHG